jgi:hypothetical protein
MIYWTPTFWRHCRGGCQRKKLRSILIIGSIPHPGQERLNFTDPGPGNSIFFHFSVLRVYFFFLISSFCFRGHALILGTEIYTLPQVLRN